MQSGLTTELEFAASQRAPPGAGEGGDGYLFTDISASTPKWERAPEAMKAAVARHDQIVRAIVARNGGIERDRAGDGFFVVFNSGAPLQCAVDIQLAMQREDWSAVEGLDIRIGVHVAPGDALSQVGANRAARIVASGWGGQIVISDAAHSAYSLPSDAHVRDLGLCLLKGVEEPLQLFSLVHSAFRRTEFPPPRALLNHARTLPHDRAPIFGRERELSDILAAFERGARFFNITGPGGQGKTRLAIEAASVLSQNGPVYFCPIEDDDGPREALGALARSLGVACVDALDRALILHLRDKRALIVLDNADNLVRRFGFMEELLAQAPSLRCLATSREPLARESLGDGQVMRLQGFDAPATAMAMRDTPAAKLFEVAARERRRSYQLELSDHAAFRSICAAAGGSPLALQLIGEWTSVLSLAEIRDRLDEGVSFLSDAGAPHLREGLARALSGSWRLLEARDRGILSKLSVLRPNFDAEAAAICGASPDDLLRLERKSLIEHADALRFALHPFVREFARGQLTAHEAQAAEHRHCRHYLTLLRRRFAAARGETQAQMLEAIDRDFDNIAKAWRFALAGAEREEAQASLEALFYFCVLQGRYHDALRLFDTDPSSPLHGYCAALRANCYVQTGAYVEAEDALAQARRAGDLDVLASAHCKQAAANVAHVRGLPEVAERDYLDAYDLRTRHGDPLGAYYAIGAAAWLSLQQRKLALARERISLSSRHCQRAGHLGGMIAVHSAAGDLARLEARSDDARVCYRQAAEIAEATNHPQLQAPLLLKLAALAGEAGQEQDHATILEEALQTARGVGDQRVAANVLLQMGAQHRRLFEWPSAAGRFREAVRLARALASPPLMCDALSQWSRSEHEAGAIKRARLLASLAASFQDRREHAAVKALGDELGAIALACNSDATELLDQFLDEDVFGPLRL